MCSLEWEYTGRITITNNRTTKIHCTTHLVSVHKRMTREETLCYINTCIFINLWTRTCKWGMERLKRTTSHHKVHHYIDKRKWSEWSRRNTTNINVDIPSSFTKAIYDVQEMTHSPTWIVQTLVHCRLHCCWVDANVEKIAKYNGLNHVTPYTKMCYICGQQWHVHTSI